MAPDQQLSIPKSWGKQLLCGKKGLFLRRYRIDTPTAMAEEQMNREKKSQNPLGFKLNNIKYCSESDW